jgi:hypothetical protein
MKIIGRINKSESNEGIMPSRLHKRLSIEELKAIVKPIAEEYGVEKVYLFGSMARGDYNENSDYDFYIESGKIRSLIILSEFFQKLKKAINHEIDLVDKEEIEGEFLNTILKEGIEIYAK